MADIVSIGTTVMILLGLRHNRNVKVTPKDGGRGGFMGRGRVGGEGYGFGPYGGSFPGYGVAYPPPPYPAGGYADPYAYGSYPYGAQDYGTAQAGYFTSGYSGRPSPGKMMRGRGARGRPY